MTDSADTDLAGPIPKHGEVPRMIPTAEQSGRQLELGLARAKAGVSAVWFARAVSYVAEFAAAADRPFLAEDVRAFAESGGFEEPTNAKAWGPVMQEAQRRGIVRACGYGPANSSNRAPKVMWEAAERAGLVAAP